MLSKDFNNCFLDINMLHLTDFNLDFYLAYKLAQMFLLLSFFIFSQ